MTAPLLSIVTVCRDHAAGLMRTAGSLPAPLPDHIEWLVEDGGSRDGGPETLASAFKGAVSIASRPDGGPYDGMNRGLDRARGDWVLFLNAGDELVSPWSTLHDRMVGSTADLLYGGSLERIGGVDRLKPARTPRSAIWGMFAHHQAMLFRHKAVGTLRFDPSLKVGADYAFVLAMLQRGRAEPVGFPICRFEGGGLSTLRPAEGRADQRAARAERLGVGIAVNSAISGLQFLSMTLRRAAPGLWSMLRGAERMTLRRP